MSYSRPNEVDSSSIVKMASKKMHQHEVTCRIYFQITTNKMQRFLIYLFLQMLYMFQTVYPPIIRSTKLYRLQSIIFYWTGRPGYRTQARVWIEISSRGTPSLVLLKLLFRFN